MRRAISGADFPARNGRIVLHCAAGDLPSSWDDSLVVQVQGRTPGDAMLPRLAADAALLAHMGFILFAVFGAALAFRWRWLALAHLPAAAWGILVECADWPCPLTAWEERFRHQALLAGIEPSRLEQILTPLIYPTGLTKELRLLLGIALLLFNLAAYLLLLRRLGCNQRKRSDCGE